MTQDDVERLWNKIPTMTLEELLDAYTHFQTMVNNTPNHIYDKDTAYQNALHAAIGMVTEASEILDPYKKNLYGKQKPISDANHLDECGDMFYYFNAFLFAKGFSLHDIIRDNVMKLSTRYAENFN